jgi:hypothetical protein
MAGQAEQGSNYCARHHLFEDHRVVREIPVQRVLALGAEVGGQLFVELPGTVLTVMRAARKADDVVYYVLLR